MNRFFTFILTLLLTTAMSAQQADGYGELKSKMLHLKEKYTGNESNSNQAIVTVLHRLCSDYPGRLNIQQYKELAKNFNTMMSKTSDGKMLRTLEAAFETLRGKSDTLDIEQRILGYYARVPQERIYLHTDRPYYVPGDTVWFRAHLVDAVTHTPISRSRYVYVELLDNAADTLCQRIIVRCDSDGVFANALTLPRHLRGGSYTLAAYTQWMRNFPAERFCYHPLWVAGNEPGAEGESAQLGLPVRPARTASPTGSDSPLQLGQRKGQLLVRLDHHTTEPLACTLYGSGNLIVTDYTPGKVLCIDSQSLRPGSLSVAIVNRQTGDIIAESQTRIEAPQPQVSIRGEARQHNEPMELTIDVAEADGTPLYGNFSLSITDYDVVKPDSVLPTIGECLAQQPDGYMLADMLSGKYPRIDYGFQTSQTISGQIRGTIFKRIKHPKLMLVRPDTGFRTTFELGDSSRFTIRGLDFPDGVVYTLQGLRRTGSDRLVVLDVTPQDFPKLQVPAALKALPQHFPLNFQEQASKQVVFNSIYRSVKLPEVVKTGRRHKPQKRNLLSMEAPRGIPAGDPRIENAATMQQLLISLGIRAYYIGGEGFITTSDRAGVKIYVDNFEETDHDYVLNLIPQNISSIEYFTPNHAVNGFFGVRPISFTGKVPGVLFIFLKNGTEIALSKSHKPRSMATVKQQGYQIPPAFYSPQYSSPRKEREGTSRPDQRTTLYWNPKVKTDEEGHATVRFYASDVSKRYLVTLEGVSDNGTVISKQAIIE